MKRTWAAIAFGIGVPAALAAADPPRELPEGTVLCAAEHDYELRQHDLALPVPTHGLAPSCFYLTEPASFTVVTAAKPTHALVILTSGAHAGEAAWTERSTVNP